MITELKPFREAIQSADVKTVLPTRLKSADLMKISSALRERGRLSAQTINAEYLQKLDDVIGKIIEPRTVEGRTVGMDYATGRQELRQMLDRLDYSPAPGKAGTIEDLGSDARLNLVLRTNSEMAAGYGGYVQAMDQDALDMFPAQELFRAEDRREPRDWEARWAEAGGPVTDGRLIALKTDPIWEAISAFGLPYPPFDFGSGMWVRDIDRLEAIDLGLMGQDDVQEPVARDFNADLEMSPDVRDAGLREALLRDVGDKFHFEGDVLVANGGQGSGNFGHAGRPGEIGGSASDSGSDRKPSPIGGSNTSGMSSSDTNEEGLRVFINGNVSRMDKVAARLIVDNSEAGRLAVNNVKLFGPEVHQGNFDAGGKQWERAGQWIKDSKTVEGSNDPSVIAHEVGHGNYDWAMEEMGNGIENLARAQLAGGVKSPWRDQDERGAFHPDGKIAEPMNASQKAFNTFEDWKGSFNKPEDYPTDYSRAWRSEQIVDISSKRSQFWKVEDGQLKPSEIVDIRSHRSLNEAFAEFSSGYQMKQLVRKGLLEPHEVPDNLRYEKMGTKESRKAYENLSKAIREMAKEKGR